jgi:hypothetical protein
MISANAAQSLLIYFYDLTTKSNLVFRYANKCHDCECSIKLLGFSAGPQRCMIMDYRSCELDRDQARTGTTRRSGILYFLGHRTYSKKPLSHIPIHLSAVQISRVHELGRQNAALTKTKHACISEMENHKNHNRL